MFNFSLPQLTRTSFGWSKRYFTVLNYFGELFMFVYNSQIPTFPFILFYKLILLTYYIIYNHELLNSFSPLSLSIYSCSLKYLLAPVFIPKPEK